MEYGNRKYGKRFNRNRNFNRNRGFNRRARRMYNITCSRCGKEAQVPFKPDGERPVYCKECYFEIKGIEPRVREDKETSAKEKIVSEKLPENKEEETKEQSDAEIESAEEEAEEELDEEFAGDDEEEISE